MAIIQQVVEESLTIWIKGEPLRGPMLGARLRKLILTYSAADAAREWGRTAALLWEMETQKDHHLLTGSEVSFENYLDNEAPGGLTANRASPMRTWMREVVPQLTARNIDPETLLDKLEPRAMEMYIPLARSKRDERVSRAGRKPAIASAGDPRLAQFITALVLDGTLRTVEDFTQLKSHPAICKSSEIMDVLETSQLDPFTVYSDMGLDKVDLLAHHLLGSGSLGDNPIETVNQLVEAARAMTVDQVRGLQISRPGNERDEPLPGETMEPDRDLIMEPTKGGALDMFTPAPAQPWSLSAWVLYEKSGGKLWMRNGRGELIRVSVTRPDLPHPSDLV